MGSTVGGDSSRSPNIRAEDGVIKESVSRAGLLTRLTALLLTLSYAMMANSLALWADFAATLIGFLALLAAWLTIRATTRGNREAFAFGYGGLENVSSLGVAGLMILSFMVIVSVAIWKLVHPGPTSGFGITMGLAINGAYVLINGWLYRRNLALERRRGSPTITAQRRLYGYQLLSNVLMVVSLGLILLFASQPWTFYIDPMVSMILALSLLLSATKTLRSSALSLLDRALEERDQLLIMRALAEHYDDFAALHGIRTRHAGGRDYVELFLEFEADRTMGEVQEIIEHLRSRVEVLVRGADVVIMPTRSSPAPLHQGPIP